MKFLLILKIFMMPLTNLKVLLYLNIALKITVLIPMLLNVGRMTPGRVTQEKQSVEAKWAELSTATDTARRRWLRTVTARVMEGKRQREQMR